jgi:hypothetical protein
MAFVIDGIDDRIRMAWLRREDNTALGERWSAAAVRVDIFPCRWIAIGELIWSDPNYVTVVLMERLHIRVQVAFPGADEILETRASPEEGSWIARQRVKGHVVDRQEEEILLEISMKCVRHLDKQLKLT